MIGATVLIVDDHRLFADVVASALGRLGARVLGPVRTAAGAVASARAERPDVVLMDPHLPDGRAVEAGRTILEASPDTILLALSASPDRRLATEVVRAGFHGFVPKDARLPTVVEAIRGAMDGRSVMIRPVQTTPAPLRGGVSPALLASELTRREREVLELLVAGLGSRAIADELGISLHTVRTHVKYILTKLQAHSRLEAAAFAVRHGLAGPRHRSRASA
jgi:DNA-binding NarL/FixJ family response regulator